MGTDKEDSGKSANLMSAAANHNINYPNPFQKGWSEGEYGLYLANYQSRPRLYQNHKGYVERIKVMDIYDIIEMLKFGEGWTVEFKEILPKPAKLAHTIVAFANHQGGTILIGVNDMGEPVGFETTREHYEDILRAAREAVIPSIHYEEIKEVEVYGKRILAIKVPQGIDQVYSTSDGRYLVRENVENVGVDWQKLYQLMAKMERVSFEELPCERAFFEDIDLEKVRVFLRAREERLGSKIDIPIEDVLRSRKCILEKDGRLVPTHAGIVLFGKEPRKLLPQSYITVVKFRGRTAGGEYLDRKDITGNLTELVNQTVKWVDEKMFHGGRIISQDLQRQETMQFHLSSVREVVVNAVTHRDYGKRGSRIMVSMFEDRLEVQSPGRLPANITTENIMHEQYARNPNIMLVLLEWGYSEGIGRGIDDIFESMKQGGYRLPKMEDTEASFIFTLHGKDFDVRSNISKNVMRILNDRQKNALKYIREKGKITNKAYRDINRVSNVIAVNELKALVQEGVLKQEGAGRSTRYVLENGYG